jgi:hypothetical protein
VWFGAAQSLSYEDGVSAVIGLGDEDPFQTYLKVLLHHARNHIVIGFTSWSLESAAECEMVFEVTSRRMKR